MTNFTLNVLDEETRGMLQEVRAAVSASIHRMHPHKFVHVPALSVQMNSGCLPIIIGGPRRDFTLRLACLRHIRCDYRAVWLSNGLFEFHQVDPRLDAHWLNAQLPTSTVIWKSRQTPHPFRDIDQMRLFVDGRTSR